MFVHVIRFVWEGPGVDSFVALQFQTGLGLVGGVFFSVGHLLLFFGKNFIVSQDLWRSHFLQLLWKCHSLDYSNLPIGGIRHSNHKNCSFL